MITIKDYLTASGKYPDREHHPEVTPQLLENATKLLIAVNSLLDDLGIFTAKVSSGFRPSDVNAATPGSAKKSAHLSGLAIDLEDPDGKLDELISMCDPLKKKYGLWQEDPAKTVHWAHIDQVARTPRAENTFKP